MEETKIITRGWPNDNEILLDEISMTYIQNPDCTEDREAEPQSLTISTRDNGCEKFLNIKTDDWSIDDIENLSLVIEDFKKRIGYDEKYTSNS